MAILNLFIGILLGALVLAILWWKDHRTLKKELRELNGEMINHAQSALEKMKEAEENFRQKEEDLNDQITKLTKEKEDLTQQVNQLKEEHQRLHQWVERQMIILFQEIKDTWDTLKLPLRYEDLINAKIPEKTIEQLRPLLERFEGWQSALDFSLPDAFFYLGLWHRILNQPKTSLKYLQTAAHRRADPHYYLSLGDAYWELHRPDQARSAYGRCLHTQEGGDEVIFRYAQVCIDHRDYESGLDALEKVISQRKVPEEIYALASYAYGMMKMDEKAVEVAKKGQRHYRKSALLEARKIIPLARLGQWEEAEEAHEKALRIDPAFAEAPFSLGVAHMHHGDDEKAEKYFKEALKIKENYPQVHYCLGVMANRAQKFKKALRHLKKAVSLKPDYAEAYYAMHQTYEGLKDLDKAVAVLKKATSLNPKIAQS